MIGECYFSQKKFDKAIEAFDDLIVNYPLSDKIAAAYWKKGLSLAELKKKDEAIAVLRLLITKYPARRGSQERPAKDQGTAGKSNERRQQPEQGHPDRPARPEAGAAGPRPGDRTSPGSPWPRTSACSTATTNESSDRTEWHKIVVWGKLAEFCEKYLDKGRQILIEGKLRTRSWQDRDGNKRTTTEIEAQSIVLLGGRREGAAEGGPILRTAPAAPDFPGEEEPSASGEGEGDDEVPF